MLPLQNFTGYIHQNALFSPGDQILLAVSGGKDSVLMAHFFKQAGLNFGIAHCNFGLRSGESQRDEHFVRRLAAVMDVPIYVTHFETKAYAAGHKISTQMAARDLRYQWFEELRITHQYDCIALAHHQDDAIETVLLNLVRGTGIAGLHGILPKRDHLIRPLLFLSRKDIDELIRAASIDYVEDSSNLSADYARNKLRLEVIPRLKEINPSLEETFAHNIERFADTELVLQQRIAALQDDICERRADGIYLSIEKISTLHPKRLLMYELLKPYGFSEPVSEELLDSLAKQSGTSFYSASHRLTINRQELIITRINEEHDRQMIQRADRTAEFGQRRIEIRYTEQAGFENNINKAFVDLDKLIFPLVLRTWQEGDRFMPLGMKNYKKMSDFFIDKKVPLPEKEHIPILVNGNGEIVWVAGLRQDNRYKVTSTTKKVAIFEQKFI
ncbi:tRNA(Ile)-lysidine synthase [Pedobacter westerhofensis]|uniref:tRNA(Ile)-lysidine synthase n=1 Tax=Pedobacter westerhofensis TaxID=425512 RepID=A0A521DFE0_9SPHI|nr:tRNA lysidine(34) synthetase TilS [Pedobacter westerhofensis]SMO70413.1 tRNA(Ile)-lysidine synthase [Pedobacter westerhofensis]